MLWIAIFSTHILFSCYYIRLQIWIIITDPTIYYPYRNITIIIIFFQNILNVYRRIIIFWLKIFLKKIYRFNPINRCYFCHIIIRIYFYFYIFNLISIFNHLTLIFQTQCCNFFPYIIPNLRIIKFIIKIKYFNLNFIFYFFEIILSLIC